MSFLRGIVQTFSILRYSNKYSLSSKRRRNAAFTMHLQSDQNLQKAVIHA